MRAPSRGRRALVLLLAALLLFGCLGCGSAGETVRDIPFSDATPPAKAHDWTILMARVCTDGSTASLRGRLQYRGAWVTSSCQMYFNFLDAEGNILCSGLTDLSFDTPISRGQETGYEVPIANFYNFDAIAAVEIEFG